MLKIEKKLYYCLLCSIIGVLLTLVFNKVVINDEMEHLRMSWLVGHGEVPYRDFFEHHHPLIWYLFAPIITTLPHNILVSFYTAKIIALICVIGTYYIIYLMIKRFLGGAHLAPYFFVILFTFYPIWYATSLFKPDTFSRLFYFLGLYLFFCYLETQRLRNLIYCAISFTISFLFLQTIVFSILPLAIPLFFYLYKNPRKILDCALASIVPLIMLLGGICILIFANAWKEYYQLNWILNKEMLPLLRNYDTRIYVYIIQLVIAVGILILRYHKKTLSDYEKILGIIFITEFMQRLYMPAVYEHYLILLFIFASLIIFPAIEEIFTNLKYTQIKSFIYIFLFIMLFGNFASLYFNNNLHLWPGFKMVNANEDDFVEVIHLQYVPVYTPKKSYYSLYNSMHHFDDELFHRLPEYDINELIENLKPKYLAYDAELEARRKKRKRFSVSAEILEKYEEVTPRLLRRKEILKN